MPSRRQCHLSSIGFLLALIPAAFAGQANAAAGRVDFATGGVTVSGTDGRERPLLKGTDLDSGDTIKTNTGRAQIRFTDGAYVSLQPNTDFSIKEYNYAGKPDGTERGFFGLAKGAMRAVTGLIGRVNRNRYQISTPTATVGIRGTGGLITVNSDGSTTIAGTSGIWTLTNPAGSLDIPAGKVGVAPTTPNEPPKQTNDQVPNVGPTPPVVPPVFTQGDQRTATGDPIIVGTPTNPPLVSGSGFALSAPLDGTCGGDCGASGFTILNVNSTAPTDAVFDAAGRLTQFTVTDPSFGPTTYTLDVANGGAHGLKANGAEDFGTADGVIAWGRWVGPVVVDTFAITNTFASDQGLHYVVGTPTPIASLPAGMNFTYQLIGATAPTYANGGVPPGTVTSASLNGNFITGIVTLSLAAQDGNGLGFSVSNARLPMNSSVPGALFTTSGTSATGTGCPNGCSFSANGFFAGTAATHAGVSYNFTNTGAGSDLIGAAAFKR